MIRENFVVLDMNTCRSEAAVQPLLDEYDRAATGIYIPAIANWELTKGTDDTLPASLRLLAQRPEAVSVAFHTYVVKGHEKKYKRRVDIVDNRHTRNIRDVLRGLRDDTREIDPATVAVVREHWRKLLDREDDANVLRQLEQIHRRELAQSRANLIRDALQADPPDRRPFRTYLVEALGDREDLARFLVGVDYGHVTARKLAAFPSISLLYLIALHAMALRWRVFGGVAGARDDRLQNDMVDAEYAVLAAYGRDLVTRDAGARAMYEDLISVAGTLWG